MILEKETSLFDENKKIEDGIADAKTEATNYLTFTQADGLDISQANLNTRVNLKGDGIRLYDEEGDLGVKVDSDGMEVFTDEGVTSAARFGSTARIGTEDGANLSISSGSVTMNYGEDTMMEIDSVGMAFYGGAGELITSIGANGADFGSSDAAHTRIKDSQVKVMDAASGSYIQISPDVLSFHDGQFAVTDQIRQFSSPDGVAFSLSAPVYAEKVRSSGVVEAGGRFNSEYTYNNQGGSGTANLYIASNGNIIRTASGSSRRYKNSIEGLKEPSIDPHKLYDVEVVQFKYNKDYLTDESDPRYDTLLPGFVAEQLHEVYPAAVNLDENGRIENWNPNYMIPPMLALLQEQNERIRSLEKKLDELQKGTQKT